MRYLIPIIFLLLACSPQRRFNHLITKYPYLLTADTITVHDTIRIVVPEVDVDTIVQEKALFDTVYLEKEQLKVKVWMTKDRKVYIQGKCDTVYVTKIVERKVPIKIYEKTPWYKKLLNNVIGILLILLLLYIAYRLLKFYINKPLI
jgi:hypothetical protein